MSPAFTCRDCGTSFSLDAKVLARYPRWQPSQCMSCKKGGARATSRTTDGVLSTFSSGPQSGIFTDGGCDPNPGPGGWGAVRVVDDEIVEERHGQAANTTNNQMELRALIEAFKMTVPGEQVIIYSDSLYCVKTINVWAAGWEKNGWTRGKTGDEIKNLDLVRELFELSKRHPDASLEWLKGHAGMRWNEYADALAQKWRTAAPNA